MDVLTCAGRAAGPHGNRVIARRNRHALPIDNCAATTAAAPIGTAATATTDDKNIHRPGTNDANHRIGTDDDNPFGSLNRPKNGARQRLDFNGLRKRASNRRCQENAKGGGKFYPPPPP